MKEKPSTGACKHCKIIFQFEKLDIFSGETFCPVCVSRIEKEFKFVTVKAAEKKIEGFRLLS